MSSRLFVQVRGKRGLAYYIGSDTEFFSETGVINARAGLNLEKVEEAISVIKEEFNKTKNGDVTEKEQLKAKDFLKGRTALKLENSFEVAEWFADKELLEGKIETPKEELEKIEKVTLSDISRVANRLFIPEKTNLAIIGPFEDQDRFLKLISA